MEFMQALNTLNELLKLRSHIDDLDARIIELLSQRFITTGKVGELKAKAGIEAVDAAREVDQRECYADLANRYDLNESLVESIFQLVIADVVANHTKLASEVDGSSTKNPKGDVDPTIRIGVTVPLSRPGWVESGKHLLAGLELGVREINEGGGIAGRLIKLLVRDSAADPRKAEEAVAELAELGVVAIAGEYHSVVARAVATKADALGLPFLCSSSVIDNLVSQPTKWVARLSPPQSRGWQIYAEYLMKSGHSRIAVAITPSVYWESGATILKQCFAPIGGAVIELDANIHNPTDLCDQIFNQGVTALLLLVGSPEPAVSIVKAVRRDQRIAQLLIGAPAGQPESAEWISLLGDDSTEVPFLRYMPEKLSPLGERVDVALHKDLGESPSFVAFEGYDTILVLADIFRARGTSSLEVAEAWSNVAVDGTRGRISFSRNPSSAVWQWDQAPVQIVDRNPTQPEHFRVLLKNSKADCYRYSYPDGAYP